MKRPLLTSLIVLLSPNVFCQVPELALLNKAFAPQVTFKVDKQGRLVMDHFDAGSRFRQDVVPLDYLDPAALTYSAEEEGIALKCLPDKAQCISKEIFKLDVVRVTSRITIPRPADDPEGVAAMRLLQELITPSAERTAETKQPSERKNVR